MEETYLSFRDENYNSIKECKIEEGNKVRALGLVSNDEAEWQQLNRIVIPIERYDGRRWVLHGSYVWSGVVAVKPEIDYGVRTPVIFLFADTYRFAPLIFEIGPRIGGLYYKTGSFDMRYTRA